MHDSAPTRTPMCRSAMTSGTVLMPTACAPSAAEHAHLGGRLVRRPEQAGVDALAQRDARRRARPSSSQPRSSGS